MANYDIPKLPTEDNIDTLQNVEAALRKINDILLKQSKLQETIGIYSKEALVNVEERLIFARKLTDANMEQYKLLQNAYVKRLEATTVTDIKAADASIKGIEQKIAANQRASDIALSLNELEQDRVIRRYKEEHKWQLFTMSTMKDVFGIQLKGLDIAKKYGDELSKYPFNLGKMAYVWGAVVALIKTAFDMFKDFDKSAAVFRKEMGMTRDTAKQLRNIAEKTAIEFMHIGVTIDSAYKAISALRENMGSTNVITKDIVKDVAIMSSQLGVSEANSSGFMRNMAAISGTTMSTQKNLMYVAAHMSSAAGVPLNEVMGDIAKSSKEALMMMSRAPSVVLRTAIEARRLNTTINEMAKGSHSLLQFQESVNAEMDASVLLGRAVNLQRARELAYRKDLEGSTKEILRLTKEVDFENLDVFQQEAFAKATGRSVEELLKMVQAEKEWDKARTSDDPKVRSMVENYENMRDASKQTVESESEKLKLMIQQKSNQDRMTAVSQKWNQLLSKITYFLLPAIDAVLGFILDNFGLSVGAIGTILILGKQISGVFGSIGTKIASWGEKLFFIGDTKNWKWLQHVGDKFNKIGLFIEKMSNNMAGLGTRIMQFFKLDKILNIFKGLGGRIGSILTGTLGKLIMPIMFAWNIIQKIKGLLNDKELMSTQGFWEFNKKLIGKAIGAIWDAFSELFFDLPNLILDGLKSIGSYIWETAKSWADGIWNGLKSLIGFSPSELGLSILQGIVAIGPMLFDALTGPFRQGLAWIMDKIPGMGSVAEKLRGGVVGAMESVEQKLSNSSTGSTITPGTTKLEVSQDKSKAKEGAQPEASPTDRTLLDILNAINTLNSNLASGKIAINLDGQLVSTTLARQTEFKGGFGNNKIC